MNSGSQRFGLDKAMGVSILPGLLEHDPDLDLDVLAKRKLVSTSLVVTVSKVV